jgi:hypothetical protein
MPQTIAECKEHRAALIVLKKRVLGMTIKFVTKETGEVSGLQTDVANKLNKVGASKTKTLVNAIIKKNKDKIESTRLAIKELFDRKIERLAKRIQKAKEEKKATKKATKKVAKKNGSKRVRKVKNQAGGSDDNINYEIPEGDYDAASDLSLQ